jgi:hypothetical protein
LKSLSPLRFPRRLCALSLFSLAVFALAGCGKTVLITRGPQTTAPPASLQPIDGIPFYVKRAYCQQQASWLEPQFSLNVTATVDGKPANWLSADVVLSRSESLTNPGVRDLAGISGQDLTVKSPAGCAAFLAGRDAVDQLRRAKAQPVDDSNLEPAIGRGDVLLTQNSARIVPYVDYQTVYYYNTARPLTGTSSVDAKFAEDGTLTEGSSSITDQTLSTITGVFSTALTAFGANATRSPGPESGLPQPCQDFTGTTLRFNVSNSVTVYRHTHTFKSAETNELACLARPISSSDKCADGCSLEITAVSSPDAKPKTDDAKPKDGDDPKLPKPPKP